MNPVLAFNLTQNRRRKLRRGRIKVRVLFALVVDLRYIQVRKSGVWRAYRLRSGNSMKYHKSHWTDKMGPHGTGGKGRAGIRENSDLNDVSADVQDYDV